MSWLKRTLDSSIGGKAVVAITGLALALFLVAHLSGNLLIFVGREAINGYAEGLRRYPAVLLAMRGGLVATALLHVALSIRTNLRSRGARPVPYAAKDYLRASFASRSMVLTGLLTLLYAGFHLAHFTWRLTSDEISALGAFDAYGMLLAAFSNPLTAGFYVGAMIVLGLHLQHGIQSLFQSLGVNHSKFNGLIRAAGPAVGWLLTIGYVSIPLAVLLGIVK